LTNKREPGKRKLKMFPAKFSGVAEGLEDYPFFEGGSWFNDYSVYLYHSKDYIYRYPAVGQFGCLIQFDLTGIPGNITKAELCIPINSLEINGDGYVVPQEGEIYLIGVATESLDCSRMIGMSDERNFQMEDSTHVDGYIIDPTGPPVEIAKGTTVPEWDQDAVYWETIPSYNSTPVATFYADSTGEVEIDVTGEIIAMKGGDFTNNGWFFKFTGTPSGEQWCEFLSNQIELRYVYSTGSGTQPGCEKTVLLESKLYGSCPPYCPPSYKDGYRTYPDEPTLYIEHTAAGVLFYPMIKMNLDYIPSELTSATLVLNITNVQNMSGKEIGLYHINPISRESIVKFDLSEFTDVNSIREATLNVRFMETGENVESLVGLYHVNAFWDTDPPYWLDRPAYDAVPFTTFIPSEPWETIQIDVMTEVMTLIS
jgi:hypothetical protein